LNRLIVVSNRIAAVGEGKSSVGGLAVGVLGALKKHGGIWFGWSGEVTARPASEPNVFTVGRLTYATIDLSPDDYEDYYNGFANRTLWPLFHYRIQLSDFSRRTLKAYNRVNALFAARLAPLIEDGDDIWVHDYHLIPLGAELRRAGVDQRIGFFLHTPFPAPEVLVTLPDHQSLVHSLSAYDLIGFQTESDLRAFLEYVVHEARGEIMPEGHVQLFGRKLITGVFPIGIDTEDLARQAQIAGKSRQSERLDRSLNDRDLIIGVDRLDYSKGLVERFQAFERFLEAYPTNRGQVALMQIAPPSRTEVPEYMEIRRSLEETAGHINGRFAEFDWVPIRYLNKSFNRRSLAGFFRTSRIGLVTPLRDGMNLVAKEYVASQNPEDPGVLVLSRFAGAARELHSALIVNPYDIDEVSEALERGLRMSMPERRERWDAMMKHLRKNDIEAWRHKFLAALERV